MNKKIGVVGVNSRAVAASAKQLNFMVYLIDYFRDVDTQKAADVHLPLQKDLLNPRLEEEYSPGKLVDHAIEKLDGEVDSLLITSDLGCNPKLVKELGKYFKILGNNSKHVAEAKNWGTLKKIFGEVGISYPETIITRSFRDIRDAADEIGFPVVVKSLVKGVEIVPALIRGPKDLEVYRDIKFEEDVLVQRYIKGEVISSSVLSDGGEAVTLSVNKQLIGVREFGAEKEFVYCGNMVPLGSPDDEKISGLSSQLVSLLELTGSNGVDYLLTEDGGIYFMEVNTRFQDTLECVEKFRGINLVEEHLKAVNGEIGISEKKSELCYGKGILYADRNLRVRDLTGIKDVGDIPPPGARIIKDEPVCSIYSSGVDSREVYGGLVDKAAVIRSSFLYEY